MHNTLILKVLEKRLQVGLSGTKAVTRRETVKTETQMGILTSTV